MGWCKSDFSHNSNQQQKHLVISRQDFSILLPNYCHLLKWSALKHWVENILIRIPLITSCPLLLYAVMRASHNNNNRRMSVVCRLGQQNALCCCWAFERLDEMFLGCHFIRYAAEHKHHTHVLAWEMMIPEWSTEEGLYKRDKSPEINYTQWMSNVICYYKQL